MSISKRSQDIHSYHITTLYPLVPDLLDAVENTKVNSKCITCLY